MAAIRNAQLVTRDRGGLIHRFVVNVHGLSEVQYLNQGRKDRHHSLLLLPQSADDYLCGPWSLLQAVLVLCGWQRSKVIDHQGANPPLLRFWQYVREHCPEGTTDEQMAELAGALAPAIGCEITATRSAKRIGMLASEAIAQGQVPLIRLSTTKWSHWTSVVGCELPGGSHQATALLLLDPNAAAPKLSIFNARLELVRASKTRPGLQLSYLDGGTWRVNLNSIVVIKSGLVKIKGVKR